MDLPSMEGRFGRCRGNRRVVWPFGLVSSARAADDRHCPNDGQRSRFAAVLLPDPFPGIFMLIFSTILPYNTFGEDLKIYKDGGLMLIMVLSVVLRCGPQAFQSQKRSKAAPH